MNVKIEFTNTDIQKLNIGFIVEQFKHLQYGKLKKMFDKQFPLFSHRYLIRKKLYPLFYKWHIHTGIPQTTESLSLKEYVIAKKLSILLYEEIQK